MHEDYMSCLNQQAEYRLRNYDQAYEWALKLLELAHQNNEQSQLEQALYLKGEALEKLGHFQDAKVTLLEVESKVRSRNKKDSILLDIYECLGKACYAIGELDLALEYWSDCLDLALEHQSIEHYIKAYTGVGGVYLYFDLFDDSLHHHLLALEFAQELDDPVLLMMLNLWLGSDYNQLQQFDKALHHLEQARLFYRRRADTGQLSEVLMHMGFASAGQGDFKRALDLFSDSIQIAEKNAHSWPLAMANIGIAEVLLHKQRHQEALVYLDIALSYAVKNKSVHHEIRACLVRSEVYEAIGDYEQALLAYERYCLLKTQLIAERTKIQLQSKALRKLSRSEVRLRLLKTEQQRKNLENDRIIQQAKFDAEKDALLSINEAKNEFLALVSHEIRTPLSGVIGMLRLVKNQQELRPHTREQINIGLENAEMLLEIMNDLLDASKIEAGKISLESIAFDLHKVIAQVAALFAPRAEEKGLSFIVDVAYLPHGGYLGDPTRIRQVLFNLISNAIKFTEQGSIRLSAYRDGSQVKFTIADTGIGLDEQSLGRLFNKFEQADKSTTRKYGGTGLGLSICRSLIELMQGSIAVTSQLNEGTCFRIDLPLDEVALAPSEEQEQEDHSPIPYLLNVLYAEDIVTNQLIVRAQLEEMGVRLQVVETGVAAIEALAREDYDLVLMDGRMPEMDGLTATRFIRQGGYAGVQVRDPEIYIVALTANAGFEEQQAALNAGMNDYLLKPIDANKLRQVILTACEHIQARGKTLPPRTTTQVSHRVDFSAPDQQLLLQLEQAGVAVNEALHRLNGNITRFKKWLAHFFTEHKSLFDELDQLVRRQDVATLIARVHALRGVSGTLGLSALYDASSQLEQHLNAFIKTGGMFPDPVRLEKSWSRALKLIYPLVRDSQLSDAIDSAPQSPLPVEVLPQAQALIQALQANSLRARSKLSALLEVLGGEVDAYGLQAVQGALDRLDYPTALSALQAILPRENHEQS